MMRKLVSRTTLSIECAFTADLADTLHHGNFETRFTGFEVQIAKKKSEQFNLLVRAQRINDSQILKMSCEYIL